MWESSRPWNRGSAPRRAAGRGSAPERSLRRSLTAVAVAAGAALLACVGGLVVVLDFVLPRSHAGAGSMSGVTNALRVLLLVDVLVCVFVMTVIIREREQLFALGGVLAHERDRVRATGDDLALQSGHMRRVLGVAERLAGVVSVKDVAAIVTPAVREITGAEEAVLWLAGEDGSLVRAGGTSVDEPRAIYLASSPPSGDSRPPEGWAVSLVASDVVVGVLEIRGRNRPAAAVASIVEALAAHTAGAIEVNRRYAALRTASHTDPLTSLPNRAALELALSSEWDLARRTGRSLALVMVDVDNFKEYNDLHGHQEGDAALSAIGKVLGRGLRRRGDSAYRYGGEEFVILLPGTDARSGSAVAERLRLEVRYASGSGTPAFPVTASFGVAALHEAHRSPAELLAEADAALYRAKGLGRDRVETGTRPVGGRAREASSGVRGSVEPLASRTCA